VIRVVVVTNRRLFASEEIAGRIEAMLAHAPRGSVLIQIREKDLDGGPLLRLAHEVIEVARPAGAPVWINDRVDVAMAADADGVHLPEHGLSIEEVRVAGWERAIGCSRHTPDAVRAAAAAGAALVQYGPVWSTPGKGEPIGVDALRVAIAPATLVAVGGIDGPQRARHAAVAGADAVAVIRAAWQGEPDVVGRLVEAVEAGVRARANDERSSIPI
jgi:thiamine-phosphate pyrophosphorylase